MPTLASVYFKNFLIKFPLFCVVNSARVPTSAGVCEKVVSDVGVGSGFRRRLGSLHHLQLASRR